jgi:hypothetical protein
MLPNDNANREETKTPAEESSSKASSPEKHKKQISQELKPKVTAF